MAKRMNVALKAVYDGKQAYVKAKVLTSGYLFISHRQHAAAELRARLMVGDVFMMTHWTPCEEGWVSTFQATQPQES